MKISAFKVGSIVKGSNNAPRRHNDIGVVLSIKILGGSRYCYNILWSENDIQIYFDYELEFISWKN